MFISEHLLCPQTCDQPDVRSISVKNVIYYHKYLEQHLKTEEYNDYIITIYLFSFLNSEKESNVVSSPAIYGSRILGQNLENIYPFENAYL